MTVGKGRVRYGTDKIRHEVRLVEARRTLGIEGHPDSRVIVRAPPGCPCALEVLQRWYPDHARAVFVEAMQTRLRQLPGLAVPRLMMRLMQSRWGRLSSAGAMTLNVNLVRAPRPCIAYVAARERRHVLHRDQDARFYTLLGRVMPDRVERKQCLEASLP